MDDHHRFMGDFLRSQPVINAFVLAMLQRRTDSDDLMQDIAAVLWEKYKEYDSSRPFTPWALGISRIQALKFKQRRGRDAIALSDTTIELLAATAAESENESDAYKDHLAGCLSNLSEQMRKIVSLRYQQELAISDIAQQVGKAVGAVEMMLVRARRALRQCISKKVSTARSFR